MFKSVFILIYLLCSLRIVAQIDAQVNFITKDQAIEDLNQFEHILKIESSYFGLKPFDLDKLLELVKKNLKDTVFLEDFGFELEKIMGEIGDRHSSIKYPENNYHSYLPFILAPISGQIIALNGEINRERGYTLYHKNYPYLKAIDDIPIRDFINEISFRHQHAPNDSKWAYAAKDMIEIGEIYHKLRKKIPVKIKFTFTNGINDKVQSIKIRKERYNHWNDLIDDQKLAEAIENKEISSDTLFKILDNSIGYIRIPRMWNFDHDIDFFKTLEIKMADFKKTDAIIIDVRNNGGGERDILVRLAPYFINPISSPWIANLAKIRIDQTLDEDISSMRSRYLYNKNSKLLNGEDRNAIDDFMQGFDSEWEYDQRKYSSFYYMIFNSRNGEKHYYYDKPVYILANERSFSAASVFVTALKGLGKIKIAGITTDGSSGRSRRVSLRNSSIRVRYSTMISIQRDGRTLDTNGTEPDIYIPKDLSQILGEKDSQMINLVKYIRNEN